MKTWTKLDIAGRITILAAVAWQLMAIGVFTSERQRGDVLYLMENQHRIAMMIDRLADEGTPSEINNRVATAYNSFTLFSEWDKNPWNGYIRISTTIFLIIFLSGSVIAITARYRELKDT